MREHVKYIKRDIGYTFWVFAEQAAYLALPRLLLFPLAAYIIGKEDFGVFSVALSVTLILGMQPQNGLATGLLRHLPDYAEEQRVRLFGTALRMCHWAMAIIVTVGLVGTGLATLSGLGSRQLLGCLVPLTILLYPENQFLLILTEMRFHRQFRRRAFWVVLRSTVALIGGVLGALTAGAVGLAWGFALGNGLVYGVLRWRYDFWRKAGYDKEMSGVLSAAWLQISIAGILAVSIPHVNRIILGAYHSYAVVADFVAATCVLFVYLAPLVCFNTLILSMLSQHSSINQLSPRARISCLAVLLFGVVGLPVLMYITGPIVTKFMFPRFGTESAVLLGILIWVVPSETVSSLVRPFIYKFAPVKTIPIVNALSFGIILILAMLLIPKFAARGAAWGYVLGNTVTALMWSGICIRLFVNTPGEEELVRGMQTDLTTAE